MGDYHTVKQGECFSSLAKQFGYVDFQTIYNHPANAELRKLRPNPNVLFPGDVVYIPEHTPKEVDCVTEQLHSFILKSSKTFFRLIVKDGDEKPFANCRYELKIDNRVFKGATDGEGKLEQQIPAIAKKGVLILFKSPNGSDKQPEPKILGIFPLELGHLDPYDEISGVQTRLNNLGFNCGKVDGILGERSDAALRAFQTKHDLEETGEANDATRNKLRQLHDWL